MKVREQRVRNAKLIARRDRQRRLPRASFYPVLIRDRLERAHGRRAHNDDRSEEHTSELQSRLHLVCRLLLEKKNRPLPLTLGPTQPPPPCTAAPRARQSRSRGARRHAWPTPRATAAVAPWSVFFF